MISQVKQYFLGTIRGKNQGVLPLLIRFALLLLSYVYSFVVICRNKMFDWKVFSIYKAKIPVISIGNIVAGGTGKTPLIALLASSLEKYGKVAILSRGYKAEAENKKKPLVLSRGNGPLLDASVCGDEARMLSETYPSLLYIVGSNRSLAAQIAQEEGAKCLIIDDGMQHRYLSRDYNIVLMDSRDPFAGNYCLPRGLLREPLSGLQRADILILTRVQSDLEAQKHHEKLKQYNPKAAIIHTGIYTERVYDLDNQVIDSLNKVPVAFFCGIAKPDSFRQTIEELNADIILENLLEDHDSFHEAYLETFCLKAKSIGAQYVLCTEKDKVKINKTKRYALPILWVKICVCVRHGKDIWEKMLEDIKAQMKLST